MGDAIVWKTVAGTKDDAEVSRPFQFLLRSVHCQRGVPAVEECDEMTQVTGTSATRTSLSKIKIDEEITAFQQHYDYCVFQTFTTQMM